MVCFLYYYASFICYIIKVQCSLFDIRPDNLIKRYFFGTYTVRPNLGGPTNTPSELPAYIRKTTRAYRSTLKTSKYYPKDKYVELDFNITKEEYEQRKLKTEVDSILEKDNIKLPDFEVDEIVVQTRRFEGIREAVATEVPYLREYYFNDYEGKRLSKQKNRTLLLMEQFIYETRYKLPYVQLLQKKYKHTYRYKLGFCFALLQHLKQEQRVLYTTMRRYMKNFQALFIHVKMYEKIIRLDIDIKDVVNYIKKLNWDRMQVESPAYFDQVKNLQQ